MIILYCLIVLHGSTPLNFGHFSYHFEGNPGIPEYYEEFMHTLWEKSSEKIPVWCVSHAGHVSGPVSRTLGWTEIGMFVTFNILLVL